MGNRTLEITLEYAKDLNKVNLWKKMDMYAVVSISGGDKNSKQKKTKTPVDLDGDASPTWNFSMEFTVDEAALQMDRLTLDFKLVCERLLWDKDVGEVHVPIKELLTGSDKKQVVSYQVRMPSCGKPKGQLTFSYQFGEKTVGSAAPTPYGSAVPFAPTPYGSAVPFAPTPGKSDYDTEPVMAYPSGSSSAYPTYPPPAAYPVVEGKYHYPPAGGYPLVGGGAPPPGGPTLPPEGYSYPPPQSGYGYYGYPPPPPPAPSGYGYPPPPPPGYGYSPQPGYGYRPPPVQQPAKNNKLGMGLGAGLLGGAIGGLLVGDMISDAGGGFDCGF